MSSMVRIAAWLAWPVFAIAVLFLLLLVFLAASLSCTCVDCSSYNASRAGIWKLAMCVEAFQLDCGRLPDQLDELISEVRPEGCAGPWARASDLRDPYGSRFVYRRSADGSSFEVRGIGRDRVYGSADDVTTSDRPWPARDVLAQAAVGLRDRDPAVVLDPAGAAVVAHGCDRPPHTPDSVPVRGDGHRVNARESAAQREYGRTHRAV